jgi:TetR/AcrR family transcriptional repressor of nem operon
VRTATESTPTKDKLLNAALRLMLVKGFTATSVEEICETAGVTKGSFFHYFDGKEDLGKAVMDHYQTARVEAMRQSPFLRKSDPLERVYGTVDFMIRMSKDPKIPKSCLLGNFAQELSETHPEIRSLCAKRFREWAEAFRKDFEEAKARYAPKAAFDPESLAECLIAVAEGSLLLAKAKKDRSVIEKNLKHFRRYLGHLFHTKSS